MSAAPGCSVLRPLNVSAFAGGDGGKTGTDSSKSVSPRVQSFRPPAEGMNWMLQSRWTGFHGVAGSPIDTGDGSVPANGDFETTGPWSIRGSRVASQDV